MIAGWIMILMGLICFFLAIKEHQKEKRNDPLRFVGVPPYLMQIVDLNRKERMILK